MFQPKYKKYLIVLAVLTIIIFVLSFFIRKPEPTPQLISSIPLNKSTRVGLDQTIKLAFDLPVESQSVEVESVPAEEWTITNLSPSSIELSAKYFFLPHTNYRLTIKKGAVQLGSYEFTTVISQSDPRLVQSIEEQMKIDYPLSRILPLQSPVYRVVYSAPLTLEITVTNPNLTSQEVIDEVKSWVTQNGGDASAHKYVIASPNAPDQLDNDPTPQPPASPTQLDNRPLSN